MSYLTFGNTTQTFMLHNDNISQSGWQNKSLLIIFQDLWLFYFDSDYKIWWFVLCDFYLKNQTIMKPCVREYFNRNKIWTLETKCKETWYHLLIGIDHKTFSAWFTIEVIVIFYCRDWCLLNMTDLYWKSHPVSPILHDRGS